MKISVAIIEFKSFFFRGHLNKIAVYTKCYLLIQRIQILTNGSWQDWHEWQSCRAKRALNQKHFNDVQKAYSPQKFESFKLENPSSSTRCNIICFPFKSIFGSSYAVPVVSKLCKSKRLPIERIDQIKG